MIREVLELNNRSSVIRIPHQIDIPVTPRVRKLIDSRPFQRLARISQLGLVSTVYPGARHSRFEHSLGVYRIALLFIQQLSKFDSFRNTFDESQIEAVAIAALLHDLGHWPFCHPVEDMALDGIPDHEEIACQTISEGEIAELIENDWSTTTNLVGRLIQGNPRDDDERMLCSIISGPIDVDKMDYLYRDSLHCGVPYGMNFDMPRLINSIKVNHAQNGIAISSKGKTAAEMMVFARYVMFSEVYWHHAVRSATAMLQRLFYRFYQNENCKFDFDFFNELDEKGFAEKLKSNSDLYSGLFGSTRQLYKRILGYNANQNEPVFNALAHRPYHALCNIGLRLVEAIGQQTGRKINEDDLLIDAPPPGLEVQFKVEVNDEAAAEQLENLSPVVQALAKRQFDHFVKRVRIFAHPRISDELDPQLIENHLLRIVAEC